jgi:hypothetical protein
MYRPIQFVDFHLFFAVVLLLVFISFESHGQERICPDGKRSYFGVCPDDGNQSRPLPVPEPRPVPSQRKAEPIAGSVIKDCTECPDMVVIPAGSFFMGSDKSLYEQPTRSVNLRSFLVGKTEVTKEQWEAVMGNNPSAYKGRTLPVDEISWDDIQQFIGKLNQKTGQNYRLLSEAEWEYAARAGTTTEYSHGIDESKLGDYAWYNRNSGNKTQAVGQKLPNAFGLFDMHGNVLEWTRDCWHETYAAAPTDGSAWTAACNENTRVLRGGSSHDNPAYLRSAIRYRINPGLRYVGYGFRLARDL